MATQATYAFVEIVAAELHCRVRDDANAIGSIAGHEAPPALVAPHLRQRLVDRHLVFIPPHALDLKQNL